nr:uncharacterized protein LOC108183900 isoform X2 [Danio rerio]|eukprot:XP_021331329.1 uncharacterized protein LOC108183900 isoform X2 [Danio rerio]
MHKTVLCKDECEQYLKNCSDKCPFCSYTSMPQIMLYHIKNHLQRAVQHHDFTIVKCGLKCRKKSHFHCCYCSVIVLTQENILNHIARQHAFSTHPQTSAVLQTKPGSSSVQDSQPQSSSTQQTQPQVTSAMQAQPQSSAQQTQPQVTSVRQAQPQSSAQQTQPQMTSVRQAQPQSSAQQTQPQMTSVRQAQPQSSAQQTQPQMTSVRQAQPQSSAQQTQPQMTSVRQAQPQSSAQQTQPQMTSVRQAQPQSSAQQTQPQMTSVRQAQPQSSAQQTQPQVTSVKQKQAQSPSVHPLQSLPKLSAKKTATCSQCNVTLLAKNLRTHIQRQHTDRVNAMTPEKHLRSQCIDGKIGIFAVEKAFHGQAIPIHVIKNTWGPNFRSACELDQCISNAEYAHITGILPFECCHVQSLCFCKQIEESNFALTENSLSQLVQEKWFGEARKIQLLKLQREANVAETPLSFHVTVGSSSTKCFISVFEPTVSYYSRMGRVMVTYDKKKNNWHCPCAKPRQSCIHKATAKWHLFQTIPQLFKRLKCSEVSNTVHEDDDACCHDSYPPNSATVKKMMEDMLEHKKIPVKLQQDILQKSKHAFPKHLVPEEVECRLCKGVLSDPVLITCRAKIVSFNGLIQGVSTYYKLCHKCNHIYRYQEWQDGLHNFNDHVILTLHLCLVLRNSLQNHTAVGRVVRIIEATEGESLPKGDLIMQAYLHFEALCDLDYMYSCVSCGYSPSTVIMDLHKKGVFSIPVSEIPSPPLDYDGHVDIEQFWNAVAMDVISRGFYPSGKENPFKISPSYHYWSPWIGPKTRGSTMVLNTENAKVHSLDGGIDMDVPLTEERLGDELLHLKIADLKKLCRQCGVDNVGSKMDLVLRLRDKMSNRVTYNKVFEKIWGASGGVGVIMCPCGIVYSIKFNLRAESPRDFTDLLLSWKNIPNVTIYDYPRGLVAHTNKRQQECPPFHPFEGRVQDPTTENIKQAKEGKLKVHLPWLAHKKNPADPDCHPVTGSSDHYCLCDVFHQSNSRDERDVLRTIGLVPELAGKVNSQRAEQLFSEVKKNNYFMNMLRPAAHIFLARNILHHRNLAHNQKKMEHFNKLFHGNRTLESNFIAHRFTDKHVFSDLEIVPDHEPVFKQAPKDFGTPPPSVKTDKRSLVNQHNNLPVQTSIGSIFTLECVQPNKACWTQPLSPVQLEKLNHALLERGPKDEFLASVGGTVLTRLDFQTLGLLQDVEATILNACLSVIKDVAGLQGITVHVFSPYVTVTWLPPMCGDPLSNVPKTSTACMFRHMG